ncbi:MAG: choice-of-anchor V domain-containing protein [Bacteroidota bacterium]|jgi:hypothetical protein
MFHNKLFLTLLFITGSSLFISAEMKNSGSAPGGFTGAEGVTCNTIGCHGGNALNSTGGSVVINGIPATYVPGAKYDFTVTINHGSANRNRWGFAMKAVSNGNPVGTFSESNPNVFINSFDSEIGHSSAPTTSSSNTYTFTNLSWTAPSLPSPAEQNITFYVAGNAANGIGSSGDFIYTSTRNMTQASTSVSENDIRLDKISTLHSGKKIMIQLELQRSTSLQIALFNMNGQRVLNKASQSFTTGFHTIEVDGSSLPSGSYIISIQNEKTKATGKVTL